MKLQVDPRAGSAPLIPILEQLGVQVDPQRLIAGDAAFIGNGPGGRPVLWGCEVKHLGDVLQCINNGRFAGTQLGGMQDCYEVRYLLLVDPYRPGKQGELEVPRGAGWQQVDHGRLQWLYRQLQHWLITMELQGGMRVWRVYSDYEAACWLKAQHSWWTSSEWEEHRSHLQLDDSAFTQRLALVRPTLVQRMARQLDGVGNGKAEDVAKRFSTVYDMVTAGAGEWLTVSGIGKTLAARVYAALRART